MPLLTLADIKPLSQDKLVPIVIDEFRKSPLLNMLFFDNTVKPQGGNTFTYSYNRITSRPASTGRAINSEYTESKATTTAVSVALKIFGGKFGIDRALANVETGQVVDNVTFQMQQQIEAATRYFNDQFINGDSVADVLSFDGINKAVTGSTTELDAASIDLSTGTAIKANYQAFLHLLRKHREKMIASPTAYLVNEEMYAVFQSIADNNVQFTETRDTMGNELIKWGNTSIIQMGDKAGWGTPIIPTTTGLTSIYPVYLAQDGVHGVTPNGASGFNAYMPDFTTPGAVKNGEVEMIAAIAIKATRSAGKIKNIKVA